MKLDTIIRIFKPIIEIVLHFFGIFVISQCDSGYTLLIERNRTEVIRLDAAWISGARRSGVTRARTDADAPRLSSSACRHPSRLGRSVLRDPLIELRPRWARLLSLRGFQQSNPFSKNLAPPLFRVAPPRRSGTPIRRANSNGVPLDTTDTRPAYRPRAAWLAGARSARCHVPSPYRPQEAPKGASSLTGHVNVNY